MVTVELKKILVVDDQEVIRNFYRDSLNVEKYIVDTATDCAEGLERLNESVYDLVITDIKTSGLDGIGLCMHAVGEFPYLKDRFLFITGVPAAGDERFSRICRNVLLKPFKMSELFERVSELTGVGLDEQFERSGLNRRKGHRVFCNSDCYVISEADAAYRAVIAKAQDISARGLQIRYFGDSIKPGVSVRLSIGNAGKSASLKRTGHIVWAHGLNRFVSAGVEFKEPLPPSLMDDIRKRP